ncbi:MAG: hypothetical protein KDE23_25900, partial [Caldilinea sp.]|nr:hypothetical protein [Caldilinea sp.]
IISASLVTSDTTVLPALSLLSSRGESLTYGGSDGATGSARIPSYVLREDESYFVRVEGLDVRTAYQLRVDPIEPGKLSVGQTVQSATNGDTLWNLNAAPGQIVQISLRAAAGSSLDTLIRLFDGAGQLVSSDDDGGAGYDSLLPLVLPDSQSYLVQADRLSGTGAFELAVTELTPQALPLDGSPASLVPDRAWSLTGQVGQVLTVTIQDAGDSSVPYLTLMTADGVALASSDGAQSLGAVLPQDGDYYLFAHNIADSGEDSMTASLPTAVDAPSLGEMASQTLYRLATGNVIAEALSLYRWGTADGAVQFTADARNALCWHGALRGAVGDVIEVCEDLPDSAGTSDPSVLAMRHDSRGLARALRGNIEGAIEDFEVFAASGYNAQQAAQRRAWIDRLRAGDPVNEIFDEATLEMLLQQ